jgi:hypothetical protein
MAETKVVLFMFRILIVLADWLVQQQICDLVCVTVGPILYLIWEEISHSYTVSASVAPAGYR